MNVLFLYANKGLQTPKALDADHSLYQYHVLNFLETQTIEEFHNIFGPELKAVTGDSEKIEEVVNKVDCLVLDIETVRFDPYNPLNRSA